MQPVAGLGQGTQAGASSSSQADNRRIDKSSKDFETLLLSNWLEKAYDSFGTMPGAEDDEDLDSGKEQMGSMAMQSLAGAMTASGGIGIAKMIANHLRSHADSDAAEQGGRTAPEELKKFSAQDAELSARSGR